jgi:hypothetical protein
MNQNMMVAGILKPVYWFLENHNQAIKKKKRFLFLQVYQITK